MVEKGQGKGGGKLREVEGERLEMGKLSRCVTNVFLQCRTTNLI